MQIEGTSSSIELQDAKKEILKRIREQESISLQDEKNIWLDSASLHLQEKGLIERSGEHNLQATRRLQIYDQLRLIEQKIEDAYGDFSLLSLYETIIKERKTTALREIQ